MVKRYCISAMFWLVRVQTGRTLGCKAEFEPSFTQQNAVDLISEGTIIKFHDNSGGGGEH